jgi:hypothetical protein
MTLIEAITRIDSLKPNTYPQTDKVRWLSILDGTIKKEIIDTHEGGKDIVFNGYDDNTPITTELLVPAPYDDIYLKWLENQIDIYNAEYGKFNNSAMAFNNAYSAFERYYNRQHKPIQRKLKFF